MPIANVPVGSVGVPAMIVSDGFDLSRKLKSDEKYNKIPLLMLTAIGDKTGFKFSDAAGDRMWIPIDDYAEKILKLLGNPSLRVKMGKAAWERTKEVFSWENHVDILEKSILEFV